MHFEKKIDAKLRNALLRHCYRMTGTYELAEDCVQEALVKIWASETQLKDTDAYVSWCYKIATNVCLDNLRKEKRKYLFFDNSKSSFINDNWVEPFIMDDEFIEYSNPSIIYEKNEDIRIGLIGILQNLSPISRAVLLLKDFIGWGIDEIAKALEITLAAVRNRLQRARHLIANEVPLKLNNQAQNIANKYMIAWENRDIDGFCDLLINDAKFTMPPLGQTYFGRDAIKQMFINVWPNYKAFMLRPVNVNNQPAFILKVKTHFGIIKPHSIHILELDETGIEKLVIYLGEKTENLIKSKYKDF